MVILSNYFETFLKTLQVKPFRSKLRKPLVIKNYFVVVVLTVYLIFMQSHSNMFVEYTDHVLGRHDNIKLLYGS